jgi:dihydrofolate reductase
MRKVVLFIASSLDGYIAGEGGSIEWLFTDEDYGYSKFYRSIDTIIMGRRTYDQLLEFDEYPYNGKKAYVFTRNTKRTNDGHADFISSDIASFVRKLKRLTGKDIWLVGGSDIVSLLLNAGLIDRIILSVHPILLGRGIPLFNDLDRRQVRMKLTKSISYPSGLVQVHYDL